MNLENIVLIDILIDEGLQELHLDLDDIPVTLIHLQQVDAHRLRPPAELQFVENREVVAQDLVVLFKEELKGGLQVGLVVLG